MSTAATKYPELDGIDAVFRKALSTDKNPKSNMARFWYEAIDFDRNPDKLSARCRGDSSLRYYDGEEGYHVLGDVANQKFGNALPPQKTCTALIAREAGSWEGPKRITFFYHREAGSKWEGGYTIETSAEHRDLVQARKSLDEKFAAALQACFDSATQRVALLFGLQSWDEPGPKLSIKKEEVVFHELPADLAALLDELRQLLRQHGFAHLYRVEMSIKKATERLRADDNISLGYHR